MSGSATAFADNAGVIGLCRRFEVPWTVGAGVEAALIGNWTWKAEYLYVNLGSLDDPDVPAPAITSVTGGQTLTRTKFSDNIIRAGLNYKFH